MKSQRFFFNKQYSLDNNIFTSSAGIVGIISDNAHIKIYSNNFITTDSIRNIKTIYLNKSISIQKNNKFLYQKNQNFEQINNHIYFYQKNNNSYLSVSNKNALSGEYIDSLNNNICNFKDISYKCDFVDIVNDIHLQNRQIQDFYIRSQYQMHDAADISLISPSLINNGETVRFIGNQSQQLLSNFDIIINDYSKTQILKIQEFLDNFPKNLNGYVLKIIFKPTSNIQYFDTYLKFNNFDAGTLNLYADSITQVPLHLLQINNCAAVQVKNIIFKNVNINIKNCKNIIFDNIKYYENNNVQFNIQLSNVLIKNSQFYINPAFKYIGTVSTNSKLYIHQSCLTFKFNNNNFQAVKNENIKKFNVIYNSQVTWFAYADKLDRLMNNVQQEFTDIVYTEKQYQGNSSNSLKNHIHASFGLQSILQNFQEFNSIISAMPVGSTFYWPRAFRFSNYMHQDKLKQINFSELSGYQQYMYTYSPYLQNYNDIYTSGQTIYIENGDSFNVKPLIPFVTGAIPLALHYPSGTLQMPHASLSGWETEFSHLKSIFGNTQIADTYVKTIQSQFFNYNTLSASTSVINAYFPSNTYKNYFYSTSLNESYWTDTDRKHDAIQSIANNFLNLSYIIQHPSGPSERTNRCDQFGGLSFSNNNQIRTTNDNPSMITILLGDTHNIGGGNYTAYHVSGQYLHHAPPHSEYWYSRQGIHVVFQVAGLIKDLSENYHQNIPAYLKNGFLKFSYKFRPPTNNTTDWYGTFMICDDYRIIKNRQRFQQSTVCGQRWPAYRQETIISFLPPGESYVQKNPLPPITYKDGGTGGGIQDPLYRKLDYYNANKGNAVPESIRRSLNYTYGDSNDIPIYGNYFLTSQNDIYLPINKIQGKYLVFGLRGTYSTNEMQLDNNRYIGKYADKSAGSRIKITETQYQNMAKIQFFDFMIIPGVMPHVYQDKVQFATAQGFSLKFNQTNISTKNIQAKIGTSNLIYEKDMYRQGGRYYAYIEDNTNVSFNEKNKKQLGLAVFDKIVSDTILCMKTSESVKIKYEQVDRRLLQLAQYDNYWCFNNASLTNKKLNNNKINSLLFYTSVGYKNEDYNTLKYTDYNSLSDVAINHKCIISTINSKNQTPNSYYLSGSPLGTSMGLFSYTNETGYNFYPDAQFYSSQYIGLTLSKVISFNLNNKNTQSLDQPKSPVNIYNYYWGNTKNLNNGINYLLSGEYTNDGILTGVSNNINQQWHYHFGLSKYKVGTQLLSFMTATNQLINAFPNYFYSPIQSRCQFKYNMGIIGNNNVNISSAIYDYDMISTNPSGKNVWSDIVHNNYDIFGVFDGHQALRRSIGLAWPLYDTTNITGYILDDENRIDNISGIDISKTLNRYNFNKIFFELPEGITVMPSGQLEIFNLNFITSTPSDINSIILSSNTESTYNWEDFYDQISYPSIISASFGNIENNNVDYTTDFQLLDDQSKVNYQNTYVFNADKFFKCIQNDINKENIQFYLIKNNTIKLSQYTPYALGSISGTTLSSTITFDTENSIYSNPTISQISQLFYLIKENTMSGLVLCVEQIPDEPSLAGITGVIKDNSKYTIPYGRLSQVAGSVAFEYRDKNKYNFNTYIDLDKTEQLLTYTASYKFKNLADILLFYIHAKSYVNHFMIKFNKLFNHITNYKYDASTKKVTISTYSDTFNNPSAYFNSYTAYALAGYSNLNDLSLWKQFTYNTNNNISTTFNKNTAAPDDITFTVLPYGNMNWTKSINHSKILGRDYPITNSNIYNYDYNIINDDGQLPAANINDAIAYTISSEHMMSFYRPFYLQFKNMYNTIDWSQLSTLTDLQLNESPADITYNMHGFTAGFIKLNQIIFNNKNNQYYEKSGYCINYNAFNKDFGWFNNNFSFDSIINPNLDNLSTISLNNVSNSIASELSAGLLQPSLTKQQIINLNKWLITTTLTLDLTNNSEQFMLNKDSITIINAGTYNNNKQTGVVYYNDNSQFIKQYTSIINTINISGPEKELIYNGNYLHNIQYTYFDRLTFKNLPKQVNGIYLSYIITDISNNSVFDKNLDLTNVKFIQLGKRTITAKAAFKDNKTLLNVPLTIIIPDTCIDTSQMFMNCTSITTTNNIQIGKNVKTTAHMFDGCIGITTGYYTNEYIIPSTVIDCSYMFANCINLQNPEKIQIGSAVSSAAGMFMNCSGITDLTENIIFNSQNTLLDCSYMFKYIQDNTIPSTLTYIPSSVQNISYIFADWTNNTIVPSYINLPKSTKFADGVFKNNSNAQVIQHKQFIIPENVVTTNQTFEGCKKLYIQQNQFNIETDILSSCNRMFKDCLELDKIPFILPTSVVNCSGMFENDEKIPLIPEGFTFHDGLINTNSMFKNCDSIPSIPIWFSQTTTIENIGSMFEGMHNIFKLDNTYTLPTSVINAENMFRDCANLVDLDVNRFLSGMLDAQYNEQIKLSGMFAECSILTGTISNELVSALVELPSAQVLGMFAKCVNLTNYIEMPYILTLEENN